MPLNVAERQGAVTEAVVSRPGRQVRAAIERIHAVTLVLAALLLLAWEMLSARLNPYLLPPPAVVARGLVDIVASGTVWRHVEATLYRVAAGFALAVVLCLAIGLLVTWLPALRPAVKDINAVLNATSVFVWIVLAVIWFGLSDRAPIFTTLMITIPVVLSNIIEGIENVDRKLLEMASVYRYSHVMVFRHIIAFSVLPYLVAGMRVAFALGLRVSVVAEIFGVSTGVGYMMNFARDTLRTDLVFVWAIILILIMLVIDKVIFNFLSRKVASWS